ncbi:MAG: PQQ-binding-like beta-propeller repeat protein, partial [Verrucomicrobiota bacterium]
MNSLTCVLLCGLLWPTFSSHGEDWPQWLGPDRDGIWKEGGILTTFPKNGPEILWRVPIGAGYAGPAVADGRVFVTDRLLAPDAQGSENPFKRGEIPGTERILCFAESDGELLWEKEYPANYTVSYAAGPRAVPTVDGDFVYTLGAEGNLFCFHVETGEERWSKSFRDTLGIPAPVWGFAAPPLVYRNLLICLAGGDGSVAIAYNKETGQEVWRSLSWKEPGYCPPTLLHHGGRDQIIIWHPGSVNSLDPLTGEVFWSVPWELRAGLSIPTPKQDGDLLFLTAFYNGSTMLRLNADQSSPQILWQTKQVSEKRTTHLNSIMPTPVLTDGLIFGTCSYGEFRCLDQLTGERLWESMQPSTGEGRKLRWFNNHMTPYLNHTHYFLFSETGDL